MCRMTANFKLQGILTAVVVACFIIQSQNWCWMTENENPQNSLFLDLELNLGHGWYIVETLTTRPPWERNWFFLLVESLSFSADSRNIRVIILCCLQLLFAPEESSYSLNASPVPSLMIFVIYDADNLLLDETTCYNSANNQKQMLDVLSAAEI